MPIGVNMYLSRVDKYGCIIFVYYMTNGRHMDVIYVEYCNTSICKMEIYNMHLRSNENRPLA